MPSGEGWVSKVSPSQPKTPARNGDFVLNGPTLDMEAAESFVQKGMQLIMEDAVIKATDLKEKVGYFSPYVDNSQCC